MPRAEKTRDNLTVCHGLLTKELRPKPSSSSNTKSSTVALSTRANGKGKPWKQNREHNATSVTTWMISFVTTVKEKAI